MWETNLVSEARHDGNLIEEVGTSGIKRALLS